MSYDGTRIKNKYLQKGMRGIFVGLPDDSAGWLFYAPSIKKTYVSLGATFDEISNFPSACFIYHTNGTWKLETV